MKLLCPSFQRRNTERHLLEQPNDDGPISIRGITYPTPFDKKGIVGPDRMTEAIPDIFKRASTGADETSMGTLPTLPQMAGCALIGGLGAMIATDDTNVAGIFALTLLLIAFLDHSLVYRLRDVGSATFYLFVELLYTLGLLVKWLSYTAYRNSPLPNQFQSFVANNGAMKGASEARASAADGLRPGPPKSPEPSTIIPVATSETLSPTTTPSDATNATSRIFNFSGYREEQWNASQAVAAATDNRAITTPKNSIPKGLELITTKGLHPIPTNQNTTGPVKENIGIVSPYIPLVRIRKQPVATTTSATASLTAPVPTKTTPPPRSNSSVPPPVVKQPSARSPTSSPPKEKKASPASSNAVITSAPTVSTSTASPPSIPPAAVQQERKSIDWAAVHRSGSDIYKMMQHQHASPALSSPNTAAKPA